MIGEPSRPREDGLPDHPLHGRGAGACRPRGDHRRGEIVAEGPPGELGGRAGASASISFRLPPGTVAADLPVAVTARSAPPARPANGEVELRTEQPVAILNALTDWALARDLDLAGLEVRRPSLEDVYLELTE